MTWYSTMRLPSTRTSCSFIHALRTFRSVAVALWTPCWIASSKLFSDVELISVILATDTSLSFRWIGYQVFATGRQAYLKQGVAALSTDPVFSSNNAQHSPYACDLAASINT